MILSFFGPLIFILLANFTTVYIFDKKFSKTILLTLLFSCFPLYISGILFNTFKIGYIINIVYSLIGIVLLIINIKNKEKIKKVKDNYLSWGLLSFLVVYIFIYFYDLNATFNAWDEKSHWGEMLKEMLRLDNFYTVNESTLMIHKDYPPIIQLFELLIIKLCGSFKESYALRALHLLELSVFISFLSNKIEKNAKNFGKTIIKTILIILTFLLIILMFDVHGIINTIYNDYLMAILVVYLIVYILFDKNPYSLFSIIHNSLVLSFIMLTKQVALAFYLLIIFLLIINSFKDLKNKKNIIMLLIIVIIPLLIYKSWDIYTSNFEISRQFVIKDIKLLELKDIIFNSVNPKHIIVTSYINAIINSNISLLKTFDISYLTSIIIFISILIIMCYKKILNKDKTIKLGITMSVGFIGYAMLMLVLYLFCFQDEAFYLASFDRYMDTFILIEFLTLFLIFIKYIEEKKNLTYYYILFSLIIILMNVNVLDRIKPKLSKPLPTEDELMAKDISSKTLETDKIFILSQEADSIIHQYYIHYYASPRITNLGYWKLPLDKDNKDEYRKFYDEEFKNYLINYDYLYVVSTNDMLNDCYDFLFREIKNKNLYKIKYDGYEIKLILVE